MMLLSVHRSSLYARLNRRNKKHLDSKMEPENIQAFKESSYPFEDWPIIFLDPTTAGTMF